MSIEKAIKAMSGINRSAISGVTAPGRFVLSR
jgi:hypothetical protein